MKKDYELNEISMYDGSVHYNSIKKKVVCNRKNPERAEIIDNYNYVRSLDDDEIRCEFRGSINVENVW